MLVLSAPIRRARWIAAAALAAATLTACNHDTETPTPRSLEIAEVELVQDAASASLLARDDHGAELSRALLARDHEVARIELELDGDRFVAELDPRSGELAMLAEVDGTSLAWSASDGEPMPAALREHWGQIATQWRHSLLDADGDVKPEFLGAINVPADVFAPAADVPVATSLWCPPDPICWFDEIEAVFVCELATAIWCPPPPPPCLYGDCSPCGGLYCPQPCWGLDCGPCVGLWCDPCGQNPWDPFCAS